MRKGLEIEAKSYPEESPQLSLPFDFKIQLNQYHMLKKPKAIPKEVIIRQNRENTCDSFLIVKKMQQPLLQVNSQYQ